MRKVITAEMLQSQRGRDQLVLDEDAILTPSARDVARQMGLSIVAPGHKNAPPAHDYGTKSHRQKPIPPSPPRPMANRPPTNDRQNRVGNRIVICSFGIDQQGILATLATAIAGQGGNIRDVSQTILQGYFSLILSVDLDLQSYSFKTFKERVMSAGRDLGLEVSIQKQEIFEAMHRV